MAKGSSKGSSGSKGSSSKGTSSGSKDSKSTRGSGGDSKGMGNVGWGGGAKGPSFGGGSYKASTGFGRGDTGSSFGGFKGGDGGSRGSSKAPSGKPSGQLSLGPTSYTPTTQFGREAAKMPGPSGGQPTGALSQVAPMQKEYNVLDSVKGFFSSLNPFADEEKETSGISPLGGWASYGGAIPGQEDPRGFFDKLGDSFQKFGWGMQDAPLKTLSDLASNPLVATVGAFTGTLPAMAALKGVSALKDVATNVMTPVEGALDLASTAVTHTPLGSALGELRGIATAAFTGDPAKLVGGIGGFAGGKAGVGIGQALGGALSSNPYGAAIGAMAGGTLGSLSGQRLAYTAASSGKPSEIKGTTKESGKDSQRSSPLVAKEGTMIASTPDTEADPLKFVREMELPFYGPNYQVNTYGIPNTFMMGA